MKNVKFLELILCFVLAQTVHISFAQYKENKVNIERDETEYNNIEDALRVPEKVYKLNLSNSNIKLLPDSIWNIFTNLEYLSLKNDHLKEIPAGIGNLKNLKILDLSGNDFRVLPKSFSQLKNLYELYLNDEKNMNFEKTIEIIKDLPNLKILHLENDNLKRLPPSILQLNNLETLYINNNRFKKVPLELSKLKSLKFVDIHENKYKINLQGIDNQSFGYKMKF